MSPSDDRAALNVLRDRLGAHLLPHTDPCRAMGLAHPCHVAVAFELAGEQLKRPADVHRGQAELAREAVMTWRRPYKVVEHPTFVDDLVLSALDGLRDDLEAVINGRCPHRPETRRGQPMGMYHCPDCGCMVIAGVELHPHESGCLLGLNRD